MQAIDALPGDIASEAFSVNDSGQVVGSSVGGQGTQAFLWTQADGLRALGVLPGQASSVALLINNSGQVVGSSSGPDGTLAFIWTAADGMKNLGTLPGGDYSTATGLNNSGVVVGASGSALGLHAFIWNALDGMQDLNSLITSSSVVLSGAVSINDKGQIVAFGSPGAEGAHTHVIELDHESHAGPLHTYLLTPMQ
jgi:probable HAF family extracellular repeat protein